MKAIGFKTVAVGLTISIAVLAFLFCLSRPMGPRDEQEAIQVARGFAKKTKPSYPFDQYEALASWDGAKRCWLIEFVASSAQGLANLVCPHGEWPGQLAEEKLGSLRFVNRRQR